MPDKNLDPDEISRIVMLTFGTMDHGGPYWCYVAVIPSKQDEFQRALAGKKYNMQKFAEDGYGEVIVSGEGALPPQEVTKQVAEMFNIPIKQLFANVDAKIEIAEGIERLKKESN